MIDLPLLRRAYPEGFLARRGVITVGGWTCVAAPKSAAVGHAGDWWRPDALFEDRAEEEAWVEAKDRGDLLPLVDPSDPATWACLLADLAEAVNERYKQRDDQDVVAGREPCPIRLQTTSGFTFRKRSHNDWSLSDGNVTVVWGCHQEPGIFEAIVKPWGRWPAFVADPAEALVRLRIFERERATP